MGAASRDPEKRGSYRGLLPHYSRAFQCPHGLPLFELPSSSSLCREATTEEPLCPPQYSLKNRRTGEKSVETSRLVNVRGFRFGAKVLKRKDYLGGYRLCGLLLLIMKVSLPGRFISAIDERVLCLLLFCHVSRLPRQGRAKRQFNHYCYAYHTTPRHSTGSPKRKKCFIFPSPVVDL